MANLRFFYVSQRPRPRGAAGRGGTVPGMPHPGAENGYPVTRPPVRFGDGSWLISIYIYIYIYLLMGVYVILMGY